MRNESALPWLGLAAAVLVGTFTLFGAQGCGGDGVKEPPDQPQHSILGAWRLTRLTNTQGGSSACPGAIVDPTNGQTVTCTESEGLIFNSRTQIAFMRGGSRTSAGLFLFDWFGRRLGYLLLLPQTTPPADAVADAATLSFDEATLSVISPDMPGVTRVFARTSGPTAETDAPIPGLPTPPPFYLQPVAGGGGGQVGGGATPTPQPPTAYCNDGTFSYSQNCSGTCSSHGGVKFWFDPNCGSLP